MHVLSPLVIALVTLGAAPAHGTTYRALAVPDTLTVVYPEGDVGLGQKLVLGSYGVNVPADAYAFTWNTSVGVQIPNGTHIVLGDVYSPGGCGWPTAVDVEAMPGSKGPISFFFDTASINQTGM